ncbi:MAG: hypothetical protein U1E28_02885 [Beijerinckiaceae bacterium]
MTLAELLLARGIESSGLLAHRNALDPRDASDAFATIGDLARTGHDLVYERMQDGPAFGDTAQVLSFRAEDGGRARLAGFRRLKARRPGIAPGDIVYDYDVAHLLHDFISRAKNPVFYDAFDLEGLEDLVGRLVVRWPEAYGKIAPAGQPELIVAEG